MEYNYMFDIKRGIRKINSIDVFIDKKDEWEDIFYVINNTSFPIGSFHKYFYEKYIYMEHFMKGDGFVYVEPAENDQCEPCILLKNLDNINEFINKYINEFINKYINDFINKYINDFKNKLK